MNARGVPVGRQDPGDVGKRFLAIRSSVALMSGNYLYGLPLGLVLIENTAGLQEIGMYD